MFVFNLIVIIKGIFGRASAPFALKLKLEFNSMEPKNEITIFGFISFFKNESGRRAADYIKKKIGSD
jgi:hypothetical protein